MADKVIKDYAQQTTFQSTDAILFQRGSAYYYIEASDMLAHLTTTNLAEGAQLYYTDERVDDRVSALIQNGTGITWSYNDGAGTLTPTVSLSTFSTANLAEDGTRYYVRQASMTVDHAELLALNTTSLLLHEVANGNFYAVPVGISALFEANGSAYTNSGIDIIDRDTGNILFELPSTLINSTTNKTAVACPVASGVLVTAGGSVYVKAKTSDPTGGASGSLLKVTMYYITADFDAIA